MKKPFIVIISFIGILNFQNCSTAKNTSKKTEEPVASFEKSVMPIMKASCTPCHFPPDGRKEPLNNYNAVKAHIVDIIVRVKLPKDHVKFMPFKSKKPALSDSLIKTLEQWQKQNMPQ
jgi:hypothetical protein